MKAITLTGNLVRPGLWLGALLGLFLFASPVAAAEFRPDPAAVDQPDTNPGDGICMTALGKCSLRAAVMEANFAPGLDTITLVPGDYTVNLPGAVQEENDAGTGDLDIVNDLQIIGGNGDSEYDPAATVIDAKSVHKVLSVNPDFNRTVNFTMKAVTITGGNNTSANVDFGYGGGMDWEGGNSTNTSSFGSLYLHNVVFRNNSTGMPGGGLSASISFGSTSTNKITLEKVRFDSNTSAHNGGGLWTGFNAAFDITDAVFVNNKGSNGGGLWTDASSTAGVRRLERASFTGNQTTGSGTGGGGGAYLAGPVTVRDVLFASNTTTDNGGGVRLGTDGTAQLTNVTLSGNTATDLGGGAYFGGSGSYTFTNVTVYDNRANGAGGGLNIGSGAVLLKNTIVAQNRQGTSTSSDIVGNVSGSSANNLLGTGGTGGLTASNGNQINVPDARLAPLALNGGTRTNHMPLSDSPAIDAGNDAFVSGVSTDIRGTGFPRIRDGGDPSTVATVDIGAVEAHPAIGVIPNQTTAYLTPVSFSFPYGDSTDPNLSFSLSASPKVASYNFSPGGAGNESLTINPAPGPSGTVTLTVSVNDPDSGVTATRTFDLTIQPAPDMRLRVNPDAGFRQGDTGKQITYHIDNVGSGSKAVGQQVQVQITVPSGLAVTNVAAPGWGAGCVAGPSITCVRSDALSNGSAYPDIVLTVSVAANATSPQNVGAILTHAGDPDTSNNSAPTSITITQSPDLAVALSDPGQVVPGQTGVQWTVTVTNGGPGASGSISLTNAPPSGFTYTAMTGTGWTGCNLGTGSCTLAGGLTAGGSSVLTVTATAPGAPGDRTNTASVSTGYELNTANNGDTKTITVQAIPDLVVTQTDSGPFHQGQTVGATYMVNVTNQGTADTSPGITLTVTPGPNLTATAISGGTDWDCQIGSLICTANVTKSPTQAFAPIAVTVSVGNSAGATVSNRAVGYDPAEIVTANSDDTKSTTVHPAPDLTVTKTPSATFAQGDPGTYTLRVTNSGAGPTYQGVMVTWSLDANVTLDTISTTAAWSCTPAMSQCTTAVTKGTGLSFDDIVLNVTVNSTAPPSVTTLVTASGGGELVTSNSGANAPNAVTQKPDLAIALSHGAFSQGDSGVTYTVSLSNNGTGIASGSIPVTVTLPTGFVAPTGASPDGFNCSTSGLVVTCNRATAMAPTATATITITADVDRKAGTPLSVKADVDVALDTNDGNDHATDPTTITAKPDLAVDLTATPPFQQGKLNATYSVQVTNEGSVATSGTVTVTVDLDPGLTPVSGLGGTDWNCNASGPTFTCTATRDLPGTSAYDPINLTVKVADDAPATVSTKATVANASQIYAANDQKTVATTVELAPDLGLFYSHSVDPTQGQPATITLTVTNKLGAGPTDIGSPVHLIFTLANDLQSPVLSAGADWNCTPFTGQTLDCTSSALKTSGQSYTPISITVGVSSTAPPIVTSAGSVTDGGELGSSSSDNNKNLDLTVIQLPDLELTFSPNGDPFPQGATGVTYNLHILNKGNGVADGTITLSVTNLTGLSNVTIANADGFTCTGPTCTRTDDLGLGEVADLVLTADVDRDAAATLTPSASVTVDHDVDGTNDVKPGTTTITQMPDLAITMTPQTPFKQGQVGAYELTVKNVGSATATQTVTVTSTLPDEMSLPTWSALANWSCTDNGRTFTCTTDDDLGYPNVPYAVLTLKGKVADDAPDHVALSASVSGGGQLDPKDTVSASADVEPAANLVLSVDDSGFTQGGTGTLTFSVKNADDAGPTLGTVTLTATLPATLLPGAVDGGSDWSCTLAGQTLTCNTKPGVVKNAGQFFSNVTLGSAAEPDAPTAVTVPVSVTGGAELTPTLGDNHKSYSLHIVQKPELAVTITADEPTFDQGQSDAAYTVTLTNSGSGETEHQIELTVGLDPKLTLVPGGVQDGFTCVAAGPTVTCNRSDPMGAGESAVIHLTVAVDPDAPATVTTTADVTVTGDAADADDHDDVTTDVNPKPDLRLTLTPVDPYKQGLAGTFQVLLNNEGNIATIDPVTVTDVLPPGLKPDGEGGSGDGWACSASGQTISCTSGEGIAVGNDSKLLTLNVIVDDNAPASLTNRATLTGGGQLNPGNDFDEKSVTVKPGPDLTLAIGHSGEFKQGGTGEFILTVTNDASAGPTRAASDPVLVTATLPDKVTPTSVSDASGWTCDPITGQTVTCERNDERDTGLPYPPIKISVSLANDAPVSVTAHGSVAGGGELPPVRGNNAGSDTVGTIQFANLALSKSHTGNFQQSKDGVYTLTVTNLGKGATIGTITVTDTLPPGLTYASATGSGWTCPDADSPVTEAICTRDTPLAPGALSHITLTVHVAVDANELVTNHAEVSLPAGEELLVGEENQKDDATTVGIIPDLTVLVPGPTTARQGATNLTYTIQVGNRGIEATYPDEPVTVTITLDPGLSLTDLNAGGDWACVEGPPRTCTTSTPVAGGGSFPPITLKVNVDPDAPSTASVKASAAGGGQRHAPTERVAVVTITQVSDLTISQSSNAPFVQGQSDATYTITVKNVGHGPTDRAFTVTDALPEGLKAVPETVSASLPGGCTVSANKRTVTCNFAADLGLGVGPELTITFQANVSPTAPGTVTNRVDVTGGGEINDDAENHKSADATVEAKPNLVIAKSHRGNFSKGRRKAPYEIVVSNHGGAPTDDVVTVHDTLPAWMTAVEMGGDGWNCDVASATCTRSDALAPGASYPTITLRVDVARNAPVGTVINVVRATGGGEVYTADQDAQDPTRIVSAPTPPPPPPPPPPVTPTVTITASVTETRFATIPVHGTANAGAEVTVNGQTATADAHGRWQAVVPLEEGPNVVTATNQTAHASITILRDSTPPVLQLTASATETTLAEVLLTAVSEPGARVLIEGKEGLTLSVKLKMGPNTFTAMATDRLGNQSTATVSVTRLEAKPACAFPDLVNHWARVPVCRMVEAGVATGYNDGTYRPDQAITRVEFAVMIARAMKLSPAAGQPGFSDWGQIPEVDRSMVNAAVKAGIISGYPDGTFRPNASVNRAEIAVMMLRVMARTGLLGAPGATLVPDWDKVPEWAREAVRQVFSLGLVSGYPDGTYGPLKTTTRAEATVIISRLYDRLPK